MATFHLDLSFIPDNNVSNLELSINEHSVDVQTHSEGSLSAAIEANSALRALPAEKRKCFTHHATVEDVHLPDNAIRFVKVVAQSTKHPDAHLPEVFLYAIHLPEPTLRAHFEKKLSKKPGLCHPKLSAYGLSQAPADRKAALDQIVDAQKLVTAHDTAATLVFQHPELATSQHYVATVVMSDHVNPSPEENADQYNAIVALGNTIAAPSNQPWTTLVPCKDKNGNMVTADFAIGTGDKPPIKAGQQLYTWSLTDATVSSATAPIGGAKRTANDDAMLQNQTWTVAAGTASLKTQQSSAPPSPTSVTSGDAVEYDWTLHDLTPNHGLSVDATSIVVDASNNFSVNAKNTYSRTLYVYYQLYDDRNQPIGNITKLQSVGSVNVLMGIPMPTDPANLAFNIGQAASISLYFGGFGTSKWTEQSAPGALLTGVWQYGVPAIFMIAGEMLTDTAAFNKIVNDRDLTAMAVAIGFALVGGGVPTAAALLNTKQVLITFADIVLGIVVKKGMEKLSEWLLTKVAAGAISNAFGPVGWIFKLAAAGLDFEEMAVTTGEILSSPATLTVNVSRAFNVTLTLHPDPRHGEAGQPKTAVWPALAQKYLATLQYSDGTTRQLAGPMLPTTNSNPIQLNFLKVPAGANVRVIAGVYSNSGWLAGAWLSNWTPAQPTSGDTLPLGDQNITENLVPLAPDTQYVFKEQIAYQNNSYAWQATAAPPSDTIASLNGGSSGTLAQLVGITINNSAYQIGYVWQASGQNIPPDDPNVPPTNNQLYAAQNLSVLANPGSRLEFSQIGFTNQPSIAYSPSVNVTQIDQTNFIIDPRNGGMNLRQVTLNGSTNFGLTGANLQSWGYFPLQNLDAIAVHPTNAVIGVSWQDHKMMLLPLPQSPSPDGQSQPASMVSGHGIRQGLMQGPKALAITPDGRILVLETINQRIQAFDVQGNPVPSFSLTPQLFSLNTADVQPDLDAGKFPVAMQAALQTYAVTFLFMIGTSLTARLNDGQFQPTNDPIAGAFSANGVVLCFDTTQMNNQQVSSHITVNQAGSAWTITDPARGVTYQITAGNGGLYVYHNVTEFKIHAVQAGHQWVVTDQYTATSWMVQTEVTNPNALDVFSYVSYTPLYNPNGLTNITYLDMATESQGNIYVLSYVGDGRQVADYFLDIYGANGVFMTRTPNPAVTTTPQNVVAAKLCVDIWRNVYTLNFGALAKPAGSSVEPGISHWIPTPPLFSLPATDAPNFNSLNIAAVSQEFAAVGITLSSKAFIEIVSKSGNWQVKDNQTTYDVFQTGDSLQVYSIPA
jgi:hypothetical protein